jgi:hypothetical protein
MKQLVKLILPGMLLMSVSAGIAAQPAASVSLACVAAASQDTHGLAFEAVVTSSSNANLDLNRLSGAINLRRRDVHYSDGCTRGDCFFARLSLEGEKKQLKPGESRGLRFNLRDFYWQDMTSSIIDFSEPKNFVSAVPYGVYHLSFTLLFPKKGGESDHVPSNDITIRVSSFATAACPYS